MEKTTAELSLEALYAGPSTLHTWPGNEECRCSQCNFVRLRKVAIAALELDIAQTVEPEGWISVTHETLGDLPYENKLWIAHKDGHVFTGQYEWRQGRNPDRFINTDLGDVWCFDCVFMRSFATPAAPGSTT